MDNRATSLDLMTGAPLANDRKGTAYLVYGPIMGDIPLAEAAMRIDGEYPADWCGAFQTFLPDSDGDGTDDLAVGCAIDGYFYALPSRLQLYRGSDAVGTLGVADAAELWVGRPGDLAGVEMDGHHDLTGDGVPDLTVGSRWTRPSRRTAARSTCCPDRSCSVPRPVDAPPRGEHGRRTGTIGTTSWSAPRAGTRARGGSTCSSGPTWGSDERVPPSGAASFRPGPLRPRR